MWEKSDTMAAIELRGRALYDALIALKPDDISEGEWAGRAGLSRGYFTDLKNKNLRPRMDTLANILGTIGRSLGDLGAELPPTVREVEPAPKPFALRELEKDIPIRGTTLGGLIKVGGNGAAIEIERTIIEQEPYGYTRRPPSLSRNLKVYALYVTGDSMNPRYRPGDLVYVDTRREASVGDDVIVQLIDEARPDADPAEVQSVIVKTLVRRLADAVELEQFNPPAVFRIERKRIAAIHRVIPLSELMS